MNFYELLEVRINASQDEIIAQFRKLAHIYHPDKNEDTSDKFRMIYGAYIVLKDTKKREKYNKEHNIINKEVILKNTNSSSSQKASVNSTFVNVSKGGDNVRYSDEELLIFKKSVLKKLDTAKEELGYLVNLTEKYKSKDINKNLEEISVTEDELKQMINRNIIFTDHLEKALIRIANKTYGICRITGRLISKERLKEVPHATISEEAVL